MLTAAALPQGRMFMAVLAVVRLARPATCAMAGVAAMLGALVARGAGALDLAAVGTAVLSAMFLTAGARSLNDVLDADLDRVNHPRRPVPAGEISLDAARLAAVTELLIGLALGWMVNLWCGLIVTLDVALLAAYETGLKSSGLPGNLTIGLLNGLLFVTGGAAVGEPLLPISLALLAGVATLGREIVKDIEDVDGDGTRRTWPMRVGVPAARTSAVAVFVVAMLLGPVPYLAGTLNAWYLAVALVAVVGFARTIVVLPRRPGAASQSAKVSMAIALTAFLVGAL